MKKYELHPLCTLFPPIDGDAFAALVADIAANGLRESIVVHDGKILDGGNRYRACEAAAVEPTFAAYAGRDPVGYVLSANLHRRHLTPGQQAAIVAAAADWTKAQRVGNPQFGNVTGLQTVADRAATSGASDKTQRMADKVARADPQLAAQVARGEKSLPAAVDELDEAVRGPKRKPKAAPVRASEHVDAVMDDDDIIAALQADNARLADENDTLRKAASVEIVVEIARLKGHIRTVESQRDEYMEQCAQLKRQVKMIERRAAVHA